jgi:hypothetical protein
MRSMDIYTYMEKEMEEKVLGVVWKRGALLLFVLLLWPWWVSVSLVLELLLLSLSSLFLSLSEEDDYERQPGMNWSLVLSLLIATSIES